MKKFFNVVAIALISVFAMSVASCNRTNPGDGDPAVVAITLSADLLEFESPAGEDVVNVIGTGWSASVDRPWVTISPEAGDSNAAITVSVTANDTSYSRSAILTVTNAKGYEVVTIEQAAPVPATELTVTPASLSFVAAGETKSATVNSETEWTVVSNNTEWLTVEKNVDNNGFIATATENAGAARNTTITVTNAAGPKTVTVSQAAYAALALNPESLEFIGGGETKTVNVTSDSGWSVTSNDITWLTVNKVNDTSFTATATANGPAQRNTTITVTNAAGSKTVEVTQELFDLGVVFAKLTVKNWGPGGNKGCNDFDIIFETEAGASPGYYFKANTFIDPATIVNGNLPEGTYIVDANSTGHMTIRNMNSDFRQTNPDVSMSIAMNSSFTISGNKDNATITVNIISYQGDVFKATYQGPYSF